MSWHQKYLETLAEGIKYLWNTGHFADATILVGSKRFRCHRAVLAAMSPHFDATFSTGMRGEKGRNEFPLQTRTRPIEPRCGL